MKKHRKTGVKTEVPKIKITDKTINEVLNSVNISNNTQDDFLESFCHKYSNINSSVIGGVTQRMMVDIEKREKKKIELEKAEEIYKLLQQKPLDKEEKEE